MIVSFCFICARRYSRLLKGKGEHSSSSEEEAGESVGSDILGRKKGGVERRETDEDLKGRKYPNKSAPPWVRRERQLTLAHS